MATAAANANMAHVNGNGSTGFEEKTLAKQPSARAKAAGAGVGGNGAGTTATATATTTSRLRKGPLSSSTSSLFCSSTIMAPSLDELILAVSTMLSCQQVRDEDASSARKALFPFFRESRYTGKEVLELPDVDTIYTWLREVFEVGEFHPECAVILLVYINRLIGLVNLPLTADNFKPIVIISLLLAQKVWDDSPLANADFSILYPVLSVKQINYLEVKALLLLQYKLTVTSSLYARYYYELRTICELEGKQTLRPLSIAQSKRAEVRAGKKEKPKGRAKTVEDLPRPSPRFIIN